MDVSEWSGNDNTSNVRLVFNNKWRPGVTVSSLIIQKVNSSHNGVFQCIPSNSEPKEIKVHVLKGTYLDTEAIISLPDFVLVNYEYKIT